MSTATEDSPTLTRTLTPTESRIYTLLQDGEWHPKAELKALLSDDMAGPSALSVHMTNLRAKLPARLILLCVASGNRGFGYRLARHLVTY